MAGIIYRMKTGCQRRAIPKEFYSGLSRIEKTKFVFFGGVSRIDPIGRSVLIKKEYFMVSKHKKHTLKCDFADRKIGKFFSESGFEWNTKDIFEYPDVGRVTEPACII